MREITPASVMYSARVGEIPAEGGKKFEIWLVGMSRYCRRGDHGSPAFRTKARQAERAGEHCSPLLTRHFRVLTQSVSKLAASSLPEGAFRLLCWGGAWGQVRSAPLRLRELFRRNLRLRERRVWLCWPAGRGLRRGGASAAPSIPRKGHSPLNPLRPRR